MHRRQNFQTVSWFFDLSRRDLLDLDPPYQRRSVWNQSFKDYFVDTVLLGLPAPAIFLFEEISPEGRSVYHVVDGKQRLTTLLEFISDAFPVSDNGQSRQQAGMYFSTLSPETKKDFWGYPFLVEYVSSSDQELINEIFDRINRNVAKLTAQELRHAKLDGLFIKTAENLAEWVAETLPRNFPRIAPQSRQQMKDIEFVGLLLLLLEEGPKGYSQDALDQAFTNRDADWEDRQHIETEFRRAIGTITEILAQPTNEGALENSRLRNQADFYSLFGSIADNQRANRLVESTQAAKRLLQFVQDVEDETGRGVDPTLQEYYEAARSASNDRGPRETRIRIVSDLLAVPAS